MRYKRAAVHKMLRIRRLRLQPRLSLVGLGKTHLATALGYAACLRGKSVLFANAIDVINTLSAAQNKGALKAELRKLPRPIHSPP